MLGVKTVKSRSIVELSFFFYFRKFSDEKIKRNFLVRYNEEEKRIDVVPKINF